MEGTFCEDCGVFLKAEPSKYEERCHACHVDELHRAAEDGYCPDGIRMGEWMEIEHKYKDPEFVEWQ